MLSSIKLDITDHLMLTTGAAVAYYHKAAVPFLAASGIYYTSRYLNKRLREVQYRDGPFNSTINDALHITEACTMYNVSGLMLETARILYPQARTLGYLTGILAVSMRFNSFIGLVYGVCSKYVGHRIPNTNSNSSIPLIIIYPPDHYHWSNQGQAQAQSRAEAETES